MINVQETRLIVPNAGGGCSLARSGIDSQVAMTYDGQNSHLTKFMSTALRNQHVLFPAEVRLLLVYSLF